MKKLLLMSCLCFFAIPAVAQDNAITIIRDDGTKEVIPLGGGQASSQSVVKRKAPEVEVKTLPAAVAPPAAVIERAMEPVVKPQTIDSAREANKKAIAAPATVPVEEKLKPVKAQSKAKRIVGGFVPKPMRKPHRRILDAPSVGEPISKNKALYIALSEAPPARDVRVKPIQDDQGLMYSVVFDTEDGGYEVLVDGGSGVIIRSGKIENGQAEVMPGHLPVR